ncbi:unnamed protein product [Protopolystoma xenopodis]|uniref:DH domain-containing protein n=1 Tax=Protopolystoma xenopodis TaxID=117903 RepID=A0A3S5AMU1_9PLAT|nr:unnamed protein product [Protopolystoma xenopodis]
MCAGPWHKSRESSTKLPLKALIVQPAQRIPRYELLIKRLIEHTPKSLADHALLIEAEIALHRMAVRANAINNEARIVRQEEASVEGVKLLERLLSPAVCTPLNL